MTLHFSPSAVPFAVPHLSRIDRFIAARTFDEPTLVLDLDVVETQFHALQAGLGRADIHYAVKANPARQVIARLVDLGAHFDASSKAEIALCLAEGAEPSEVSFGNTIKRSSDIAWAWDQGITLFAADAAEELDKIAENAPGASVYIRLIAEVAQADDPLSTKLGCDRDTALRLLDYAKQLGLDPVGLSFDVASQTRQAAVWAPMLDAVSSIWDLAIAAGHRLCLLNIGGGFPAFCDDAPDAKTTYAAQVMAMVAARFPDTARIMATPGRALVAEAGVSVAEVMLVSRKSDQDMHRWVYLNIGRFSGLAETEGAAERARFQTFCDGEEVGPCILAGPSCDRADVLCGLRPVPLPLSLKSGDTVLIRHTGAYVSTGSWGGFNGSAPLDVVVI